MNYALIVAVDKYHFLDDLPIARYSAKNLGNVLEKLYEFDVEKIIGNQLSRPQILFEKIEQLKNKVKADDQVLFYYVGRSQSLIRDNQKNYFLTQPSSVPGRPRTLIKIELLLEAFSGFDRGKIKIILDTDLNTVLEREFDYQRISSAKVQNIGGNSFDLVVTNESFQAGKIESSFQIAFERRLREKYDLGESSSLRELIEEIDQSYRRFESQNPIMVFDFLPEQMEFNFNVPNSSGCGLSGYTVQNIYNESLGSRLDAINDLAYLHDKDDTLKDVARDKLKYLAKRDSEPKVRNSAISALRSFSQITPKISQEELRSLSDEIDHKLIDKKIIKIPRGNFLMGTDKNELSSPNEEPLHEVFLNDFLISETLVTNAEYLFFVLETDYSLPDHWDSLPQLQKILNHPVTMVSWYDSLAYCEWLKQHLLAEGKVTSDDIVRLPTEAEWEKAARGVDGRVFPWGNTFIRHACNYLNSASMEPTPIGTYSPNGDSPYGCQDMAGNVWEWTLSIWGKSGNNSHFRYPYLQEDGRESLRADATYRRVIRGGGYYYDPDCVTCFTRNRAYVNLKHLGGGFRFVIINNEKA
ncbi:MAG: SUMF1/EgtB/PvdO family nonheme iron enzyme [Bacteroidota bacterium]